MKEWEEGRKESEENKTNKKHAPNEKTTTTQNKKTKTTATAKDKKTATTTQNKQTKTTATAKNKKTAKTTQNKKTATTPQNKPTTAQWYKIMEEQSLQAALKLQGVRGGRRLRSSSL